MSVRLCLAVASLTLAFSSLAAQNGPGADSSHILLLERSFTGAGDTAVALLKKGVMYWAEVDGPGYPAIRSARRYGPAALVVDAEPAPDGARRFEVHAGPSGPYVVRLIGRSEGQTATLRLYRDEAETKRFADLRDEDFAIGFMFGGGGHTAYGVEPSLEGPSGGRQFEGGIVTQSGSWFSALIGLSRQSVHDPDYAVSWFFLEPRAQLMTGRFLGHGRSDLALTLRIASAPEAGPLHVAATLIAPGITFIQHLSSDGRRRGVSLYTSWRHGWLRNVPKAESEAEHYSMNEFSAGMAWVP